MAVNVDNLPYCTRESKYHSLKEIFFDLVEQHIPSLQTRSGRVLVNCLFHQDANPSLSLDFEKSVFHCFGCGVGGGVKKFAELLGKPWPSARNYSTPARRAHYAALTAAQNEFKQWERQVLVQVTDLYRETLQQLEVARIAHQATIRRRTSTQSKKKAFGAGASLN